MVGNPVGNGPGDCTMMVQQFTLLSHLITAGCLPHNQCGFHLMFSNNKKQAMRWENKYDVMINDSATLLALEKNENVVVTLNIMIIRMMMIRIIMIIVIIRTT